MHVVLIVLATLPFAALIAAGTHARMRSLTQRAETFEVRERLAVQTMHALLESSRASSQRVIQELEYRIRAHDPRLDAVLVFTPHGEELACIYASGMRTEHYRQLRLRRDASPRLPALAAASGHRASARNDLLIPTDRCALAVPMNDENGLRAVVYVSSADGFALDEEDAVVRTIQLAALPYAIALEREADRTDATYDGLTGLLTPRAFRSRLHDEITRAHLGDVVLTLWFIDTDRFKSVNDSYGHAAGDVVLQTMASLLRAHAVDGVDVVGRNGGDEFCALIRGAQKSLAIERAQALCDAVRHTDFGVPIPLTASIGVATFPHDAQTSNELLEIADAAMYHSKHLGRDRVSFAIDAASFSVYR